MITPTFQGTLDEWRQVHQPWELRYHKHENFRWPKRQAEWESQWRSVFGFAGLLPTSFASEDVLLDVGCGSRPVLDYFEAGQKNFIDPLLADYLQIPAMTPFWKTHDRSFLHSAPAETRIERLEGICDFVLCWNVLDHSFEPFKIVDNIAAYAKPDALILIGTDLHEKPHMGHPGIGIRADFLAMIKAQFKVLKEARRGAFHTCRDVSFLLQKL